MIDNGAAYGLQPYAMALWKPPGAKVVITGFFDDSGKESDPSHRFVVLAGFVSLDWSPFHQAWHGLLLKHGLPNVHLKEIRGIATEKGWDLPKLNSVLTEFIALMREMNLTAFGVGLDMEAWRRVDPTVRKRLGDAQVFCCSRIVRRIMDRIDIIRALKGDAISIVFDRDFEYARRRIGLIADLSKLYPEVHDRVAQISFADSEHFNPLQAADLLAWETRRQLVNKSGGDPSTQRWGELIAALPSGQIEFACGEFWTQEWFDQEIPKLLAAINQGGG